MAITINVTGIRVQCTVTIRAKVLKMQVQLNTDEGKALALNRNAMCSVR